jgi:sodium-coupled neutral amino acid transporter 2
MTFPLIAWALREHITKLLFGINVLSHQGWVGISIGMLTILYIAACYVTSSWSVMSLTGSTAAVMIAFIFPALIIYVGCPSWLARSGAICLVMIGILTVGIAVAQTVGLWA